MFCHTFTASELSAIALQEARSSHRMSASVKSGAQRVALFLRAGSVLAAGPVELLSSLAAARFWWRHRHALFPATPVVIGGIENRQVRTLPLGSNDAGVAFQSDTRGVIEIILRTLPATTKREPGLPP
jgi:hypothetical protein